MGGRTLAGVPARGSGSVIVHEWKDGETVSYSGRVRAYGERYQVDFGTNLEGWSQERARNELERIYERIARGTWIPPDKQPREKPQDRSETVHVTLSRWWENREGDLGESTRTNDYPWRMRHILRHLAHEQTGQLDARKIDELRAKLRRAGLSPRSINMVLDVLAQALDDAVDYGLLPANPARGPRRREKVPKGPRSFLEPDMVLDMLDVAGEWERELPEHQRYGRRAFLAGLVLSGPRIAEQIEARRGGLDIHAGGLRLGKKTAAGTDRYLELSAFLLDEYRAHLAAVPPELRARGATLPVFPTRTGGQLNASNIRNRLLTGVPARKDPRTGRRRAAIEGVVARANAKRAAEGKMLLPPRVTPHTLRRTFASLCFFAGRDVRWVQGQLGHEDARLTLQVYAQVLARKRVDYDLVWSLMRFADEPDEWPGGQKSGQTGRLTAPRAAGRAAR
jgi:integrase